MKRHFSCGLLLFLFACPWALGAQEAPASAPAAAAATPAPAPKPAKPLSRPMADGAAGRGACGGALPAGNGHPLALRASPGCREKKATPGSAKQDAHAAAPAQVATAAAPSDPSSDSAPASGTSQTVATQTSAAPAAAAGSDAAQKSAPAAAPSSAPPQAEMPGMPPAQPVSAAGPALIHYPALTIQGFADVDFSAQDHASERVGIATGFTPPGPSSSFDLGQFVLHFTGALSPRVSYFAEISWTAAADGFTTTVERSIIQYAYDDYLKISAGRYHTPIIYWNTAYHHGLWLQTTITRPEMIEFGGELIPVHFVGLLADGTVPDTGSLHLHYDLGIGNGRGANIAEPGNAGDVNSNRAWLATVYAQPYWAYKWEIGGSAYHDTIGPASGVVGNYDEWIRTARLIYTGEKPEFLAEAATIQHSRVGAPGSWTSQAGYAQIAYRLPWLADKWKPYYRFEYIHVPTTDPVFNIPASPVPSLVGSTVGVRYDFSPFAALKVEYRNGRRIANEPHINGIFVQTAVVF
ncbi:MAG: hypothetical protein ACRD2E_14830 [Terriglobales bacterium]